MYAPFQRWHRQYQRSWDKPTFPKLCDSGGRTCSTTTRHIPGAAHTLQNAADLCHKRHFRSTGPSDGVPRRGHGHMVTTYGHTHVSGVNQQPGCDEHKQQPHEPQPNHRAPAWAAAAGVVGWPSTIHGDKTVARTPQRRTGRRAGTHQQAVRGVITLATPSAGSSCEHSLMRKVPMAFEHSVCRVSSSSFLFDARNLNRCFTTNRMISGWETHAARAACDKGSSGSSVPTILSSASAATNRSNVVTERKVE